VRPGSRIYGNSVAVHQAIRMHQQSHQIAQQNMLRQQMMNRQLLLQAAQQVAATPATFEDIQALVEISRTAEPQGLDFAQVVTRIRESTPFTGLIQLLPKDRAELYALLAVLVAVLDLILSQRAAKVEVVSPDQVEQIIERVIEHTEQSEPPSTTEPDCKP
jgi:hypothetical protein